MEADCSGFGLYLLTGHFLYYIHISRELGKVFIISYYPHILFSGIVDLNCDIAPLLCLRFFLSVADFSSKKKQTHIKIVPLRYMLLLPFSTVLAAFENTNERP